MTTSAFHLQQARMFQAWLDKQQGQTEAFSDDPLKSAASAELEALLRSLISVNLQLAEYCHRSERFADEVRQKQIQAALREVVNRPTLN